LSSQTSALYVQAVDDIRKTLAGFKGPQAEQMLVDAERLHEEFEAWQTAPPGPGERRAAVNRLFALYKEVLEYAVKK
jgi:hypothetical protein